MKISPPFSGEPLAKEQLPVYERPGDVRSRAVTMGKIADILHARGELDEPKAPASDRSSAGNYRGFRRPSTAAFGAERFPRHATSDNSRLD